MTKTLSTLINVPAHSIVDEQRLIDERVNLQDYTDDKTKPMFLALFDTNIGTVFELWNVDAFYKTYVASRTTVYGPDFLPKWIRDTMSNPDTPTIR